MPHNIEKSAFRRGEYVGYGDGVWHVSRSTSSFGTWCARHRDQQTRPMLYAFSLADLGAKIEAETKVQS